MDGKKDEAFSTKKKKDDDSFLLYDQKYNRKYTHMIVHSGTPKLIEFFFFQMEIFDVPIER